jgi:histone acetyltransferase 1
MEGSGVGGVDGCTALTFHLVWSADAFKLDGTRGGTSGPSGMDGASFHPDMVHQMFGPEEEIIGYLDPKVDVYLTPGALIPFLKFSHHGIVQRVEDEEHKEHKEHKGSGATQVVDILMHDKLEFDRQEMEREVLTGCLTDQVEFRKVLKEEAKSFHPPGSLIEQFEIPTGTCEGGESTYHIFKAVASDPLTRKYHDTIQMLPLFFIDMASMLPLEKDHKWILYYLFESKVVDGDVRYGFVGFCSVYPFFAFPDKERRCISQFLILPTHRRRGLGERLLRRIYMDSIVQHDVLDIVVETPVMDFTRLRDRVELAILRENGVFQKLPDSKRTPTKDDTNDTAAGGVDEVPQVGSQVSQVGDETDISIAQWDDGVVEKVRSKFKLYKFQVRRLYEVSKFYLLVKEKRDRSAFMEEVKTRLENQCRREFEGSAPDASELEQVTQEKLMQTLMYYQAMM